MSAARVALITGGSRGIGRGIALSVGAEGYSVVVNYRSDAQSARDTCDQALKSGAPDAVAIQADLRELDNGKSLVDQTLERFGGIDLLVNNAGVAPERRVDLLETDPSSWDRVLGVNLRGPFFLTQYAASRMIEDTKRTGAVIIFVTSISSELASTNRPEYCVSKAGASMVAQLFASRLAEDGISVFEIRPGIIATEMTAAVKELYDAKIAGGLSPVRRWGKPEDLGRAVVALASGAFGFSTGSVLHVDGGLHLGRL